MGDGHAYDDVAFEDVEHLASACQRVRLGRWQFRFTRNESIGLVQRDRCGDGAFGHGFAIQVLAFRDAEPERASWLRVVPTFGYDQV